MATESKPFKLVSNYAPAGDQPKAIAGLVKNIQAEAENQVLLGVTGSGKTYTIANVVQQIQRPTLVLAQNKTLAAQLCSEFREFFPDNAVHYFVSYYDYYQPEAYIANTDTYIEKDAAINEEIDRFRHAATHALLTRRDVLIVATVSCIYGLGDVDDYEAMATTVKINTEVKRDKFLRRLVDMQFTRASLDFKRGQFNVLGDTVEIYPPDEEERIYRLEFFGDELERITLVDHFTGEVYADLPEVTIFPAKHAVTTREKIERAVVEIRKDLAERHAELLKDGKLVEAERLKTRTEYDIEMLLEVGYVSGIENYTRYLSGAKPGEPPSTLLDYFPDDYLLVIDESHVSVPQIGGMYGGNLTRKQNLVNYGFRLPSAFDNRPLNFAEFETRMGQTIYVSATPAEYELQKSKNTIVEMIVRPTGLLDPEITIKPREHQIDVVMEEIRTAIAKKERVLVTTLTKKSSEDLTDFLTTNGVKVKYLHSDIDTMERIEILRDLRLGVIDVVVGINLLREGLDLPEVSTILILDADKEGFLRSATSLIQTIGRAARNLNGHVIMFADKMTKAMEAAINETNRRRSIQEAYNTKHGITPTGVQKAIKDIGEEAKSREHAEKKFDPSKIKAEEIDDVIRLLEAKMDLASQNLEFEKAADYRDQLEMFYEMKKAGKKRIFKK